eukprot:11415292-Alexandrium_andersonii.AAC.1
MAIAHAERAQRALQQALTVAGHKGASSSSSGALVAPVVTSSVTSSMDEPKYLQQVNKDLQELRDSTDFIKQKVAGHEALAHGWRLDVSRQLH